MEHASHTQVRTESFWIGTDLEQSLRGALEQQVVDTSLVLIGDVADEGGHGEHDMEVRDRQQLGLALGEPLARSGALTLRTVPIATGVVGDVGALAGVTADDMATELCATATLDGRHHLELVQAQVARVLTTP